MILSLSCHAHCPYICSLFLTFAYHYNDQLFISIFPSIFCVSAAGEYESALALETLDLARLYGVRIPSEGTFVSTYDCYL